MPMNRGMARHSLRRRHNRLAYERIEAVVHPIQVNRCQVGPIMRAGRLKNSAHPVPNGLVGVIDHLGNFPITTTESHECDDFPVDVIRDVYPHLGRKGAHATVVRKISHAVAEQPILLLGQLCRLLQTVREINHHVQFMIDGELSRGDFTTVVNESEHRTGSPRVDGAHLGHTNGRRLARGHDVDGGTSQNLGKIPDRIDQCGDPETAELRTDLSHDLAVITVPYQANDVQHRTTVTPDEGSAIQTIVTN